MKWPSATAPDRSCSPNHAVQDYSFTSIPPSPNSPPASTFVARATRKNILRSGSESSPIPVNAVTTFTTVTNVYRSAISAALINTTGTNTQPGGQPIEGLNSATDIQQIRSHQLGSQLPSASPSTYHNTTARDQNGLMGFPSVIAEDAETVHYPPLAPIMAPESLQPTRRRQNWTPPPPDTITIPDSGSPSAVINTNPFEQLVATYRCDERVPRAVCSTNQCQPLNTVFKRKIVDIGQNGATPTSEAPPRMAPPNRSDSKSPTKTKVPKKKPRTLTELATAAYAAPTFLSTESTDSQTNSHEIEPSRSADSVQVQDVQKSKSRGTGRPQKVPVKRTRKTKPRKAEPELLSPTAALRQVADQGFIFGTASQLARNSSPPSLPSANHNTSTQLDHFVDDIMVCASGEDRFEDNNRKLWDAASRDSRGLLIDLTADSPLPGPNTVFTGSQGPDPFGYFPPSQGAGEVDEHTCREIDSSDLQILKMDLAVETAGTHALRPKFELYTDAHLIREIKDYGFKPLKSRSGMISLLDKCWASKNRQVLGAVTSNANFSTARTLSAPRHNKRSIRSSDSNIPAPGRQDEPPPSSQPTIPSAPRASLRKGSALGSHVQAVSHSVIEIPDSESDGVSITSSGSSAQLGVSSQVQHGGPESEDEHVELSLATLPTSDQSALFVHIRQAVLTAPMSANPTKPSWYEKILLYDPIILEDFTSWLNSGQLTAVGYDGEVNPGLVKKWCEANSICCIWRESLKGKERNRL
jgi:hypothetical protein